LGVVTKTCSMSKSRSTCSICPYSGILVYEEKRSILVYEEKNILVYEEKYTGIRRKKEEEGGRGVLGGGDENVLHVQFARG